MSEWTKVQKPVMDWAKAHGWRCRLLEIRGSKGYPDCTFVRVPPLDQPPPAHPTMVIMEFKAPGGKPSPTQVREIDSLTREGFDVHVVDDPDKGVEILRGKT